MPLGRLLPAPARNLCRPLAQLRDEAFHEAAPSLEDLVPLHRRFEQRHASSLPPPGACSGLRSAAASSRRLRGLHNDQGGRMEADQIRADADQLASFGYRQQLTRALGLWSNFSLGFTYLSPVVGVYTLFAFGLATAGPAFGRSRSSSP